jgi:hypothetical protein
VHLLSERDWRTLFGGPVNHTVDVPALGMLLVPEHALPVFGGGSREMGSTLVEPNMRIRILMSSETKTHGPGLVTVGDGLPSIKRASGKT